MLEITGCCYYCKHCRSGEGLDDGYCTLIKAKIKDIFEENTCQKHQDVLPSKHKKKRVK
jgi:hypothetical protein